MTDATGAVPPPVPSGPRLRREIGLPGAVLLGLGSIIGTGVFVGVGLGAAIAGAWVLPAIVIGGLLAACNGLSSAQLAAAHPVSGGTAEYARRWIAPVAGTTAGWAFLAAKSASAATAALGVAGYGLAVAGAEPGWPARVGGALLAVTATTAVVLAGIRRSAAATAAMLGVSVAGLLVFAGAAAIATDDLLGPIARLASPDAWPGPGSVFEASALLFVAFTGYGRIATLGEKVTSPGRTIPRAIVVTLVASILLYVLVGWAGLLAGPDGRFAEAGRGGAAPLTVLAEGLGPPWVAGLVAAAAVTAMVGVLLNLLLGLSRVLLAMARRADVPPGLARIDASGRTPTAAVLAVASVVGALTLLGDVRVTWTVSAFAVLVYYALTNASALRLEPEHRTIHRGIAAAGLAGCLGLAFVVPPAVWVSGLAVLGLGVLVSAVGRRRWARPPSFEAPDEASRSASRD